MSASRMPVRRSSQRGPVGQVLVLFVLFLLVLLGISALAVDYVTWLLTDRYLQNVADHVALAGAGEFDNRTQQGNCSGGTGIQQCQDARAQMWTAVSEELDLGLSTAAIAQLSLADSPPGGTTSVTAGGTTFSWGDRIWITTPPPSYPAYTNPGGRFQNSWGITFARVDRDVRSFLGGALGITPDPRAGWATAGAIPTDFALQLYCRDQIAPQSGVCVNSSGLTIDGQGGIRLVRGDIGSNESLKVTAGTGQGVVLEAGNMFLVNGDCGPSTWSCPNSPPRGGISDGVVGKNAFYIPPQPVARYASPLDIGTISAYDCAGASTTALCVPFKDDTDATPSAPGNWTCQTTGSTDRCGVPVIDFSTPQASVTCAGQGGGNPPLHYYPISFSSPGNVMNADVGHPQSNANLFRNIDDDYEVPDPDTTATNPPVDYVFSDNVAISNTGNITARSFTVNIGQSGPRLDGISTVRYVAFWTDEDSTPAGSLVNAGNAVTLQVTLLGSSGTILPDPTLRTLTNVPTLYEFTVGANVIPDNEFNSLRLQFTFSSPAGSSSVNADERGGGVSWAGIQHPDPQPALAPMIPPGYYKSIVIPDGACAILDPTAEYSGLQDYQMPGIYRFGGSGSPNDRKISIGDGSFLIGDGVTLVFDSDWPESGSNQGVAIHANGTLVLNSGVTENAAGVTPCTPYEEVNPRSPGTNYNPSAPLADLPYSALCAAWGIDGTVTSGIRPGASAWHYCDPDPLNWDSASRCVERSSYNPTSGYRGITFYFTPDSGWGTAHASMDIRNRFEMQGGSGANAGIAFRGVMYAPYDDVKITGGNGFNTVGQVIAWSAKFNGGSAYIDLDYPYEFTPAAPYLLEPTIDH